MMKLFAILILAHLLADFTFQPDRLIEQKKSSRKKKSFWNKGILFHTGIHFLSSIILLAIFNERRLEYLLPVVIIALSHYIVDYFKALWNKFTIWVFLLDQLIHIVSVYLLLWAFNLVLPPTTLLPFLTSLGMHAIPLSLENKIILGAATIVCLIWVSGCSIRLILPKLKSNSSASDNANEDKTKTNQDGVVTSEAQGETNLMRFGRLIGYIERAIIGFFMVFGIYTGLGLLGTLKTIARFKQLVDRDYAEYFLFGTLLSMFLGMMFGAILAWVIKY